MPSAFTKPSAADFAKMNRITLAAAEEILAEHGKSVRALHMAVKKLKTGRVSPKSPPTRELDWRERSRKSDAL